MSRVAGRCERVKGAGGDGAWHGALWTLPHAQRTVGCGVVAEGRGNAPGLDNARHHRPGVAPECTYVATPLPVSLALAAFARLDSSRAHVSWVMQMPCRSRVSSVESRLHDGCACDKA